MQPCRTTMALQHDRLGIVEEPLARRPSEERDRPDERATKGLGGQVEDQLGVPHA
jgi:hypothetical protein